MDHLHRQIAETDAALEHAQRQRDGLALLALTDLRKEAALADAEARVQRHQLQRQRLEAAQRAAAAAVVHQTADALEQRLATAIAGLHGTEVPDAAAQLEQAVNAFAQAATAFMDARSAKPRLLLDAARALGQLVPESASAMRSAPIVLQHAATAGDIAQPLLTRLADVLNTLAPVFGTRVDLPSHTSTTTGIAEAAQRAHEALVDRLAGWNTNTVRAAVAPPDLPFWENQAPRTVIKDGVTMVVGSEVEARA